MPKKYNQVLSYLFLIFFLTSSQVVFSQTAALDSALIVYYPLNGNANDFSQNGLNGTISGTVTPTNDRNGNANNAMLFAGQGYIDIGNNPVLRADFPFTVSMWVKSDISIDSYNPIFSNNSPNSPLYSGLDIFVDGYQNGYHGFPVVNLGNGGGTTSSSRRSIMGNINTNDGNWHFFTFIVRSTTNASIYIDCQLVSNIYSGSGDSLRYNSSFHGKIGANYYSTGMFYFKGAIDEVRFYNRALTATEITSVCDVLANIGDNKNTKPKHTRVFPNPATNSIVLYSEDNSSIEFYNCLGVKISEFLVKEGENLLDVSQLPKGIYFCKKSGQILKLKLE